MLTWRTNLPTETITQSRVLARLVFTVYGSVDLTHLAIYRDTYPNGRVDQAYIYIAAWTWLTWQYRVNHLNYESWLDTHLNKSVGLTHLTVYRDIRRNGKSWPSARLCPSVGVTHLTVYRDNWPSITSVDQAHTYTPLLIWCIWEYIRTVT